ncbi:somatostatin receptor type 5-like [Diadema setosum]|uniref:somatostatin receptor type 5-like n=1 Tax=Diadema setosum TaxID=31175 RepID=UPI003B3B670D
MTDFPNVASDFSHASDPACLVAPFKNVTTVIHAEQYGYSSAAWGFNAIFLPIMLTLGLLDNCAFIFVVYRVQSMKTITNTYLVNLAVADMMFILFAVVHKVAKIFTSPIQSDDAGIGLGGCMFIFLFLSAAYNSSMCFITAVSVERYNAVCNPLKMHQSQGAKRQTTALIVCALSWIAAFLVSATFLPSYADYQTTCYSWPNEKPFDNWPTVTRHCRALSLIADSYTSGAQTIPFFITLVVNFVLHYKTLRGLKNAVGRVKGDGARSERDQKIHHQTARMLVVNGVLFFALLSPFEFISLFVMINILVTGGIVIPGETLTRYIYIARTLTYINSMSNPIIYTVFCKRYLMAFKQAFGLRVQSKSHPPTLSTISTNNHH